MSSVIMNENELRAALQAEYLHLQKVIEDFDGRALTIKAWSITFSLAAVGGAFASRAPGMFLVSCVSALLFWFIEAHWKAFQYAYHERSSQIEAYFRGERALDAAFQIGSSWFRAWRTEGPGTLGRVMLWPHVALPHAAVAVIALALFVLASTGSVQLRE